MRPQSIVSMVALALAGCATAAEGLQSDAAPGPDPGTTPDAACGELCERIYVSPSGSDVAVGSRDAPMKTIGAAILRVAATSGSSVMVQSGHYPDPVVMKAGV